MSQEIKLLVVKAYRKKNISYSQINSLKKLLKTKM
jgi:hypothetical protein